MGNFKVKVLTNGDDALIIWDSGGKIPNCLGFALKRKRKRDGKVTDEVVSTWVGFDGKQGVKPGTRKPSTEWPIQKLIWTDYIVEPGDEVQYQVVAMTGTPDNLAEDATHKSQWTQPVKISPDSESGISAYFNRGIALSQWLERRLPGSGKNPKKLKTVIGEVGNPVREFMGGELRKKMLALLADALENGKTIYAILYELDDPELTKALIAFGKKRANIILANGSVKKKGEDQNKNARKELRGKVTLYNRMLAPKALAHNKILVVTDKTGKKAEAAWTGSTNWTKTGLCTQANNGLLLDDAKAAAPFLEQWHRIKAAKDDTPPNLKDANSTPAKTSLGGGKATFWYTPLLEEADLENANQLINGAKEGILFLMFNPGPRGTLLNTIVERNSPSSPHYDPSLYIHGVVNQDPSTTKNPVVGLFHRGNYQESNYDVVIPEGVGEQLAYWQKEMSRKGFLGGIGFAMIHSKVVLIDPFGDHPVVITGSHNLGPKASSKNDDNMVIIENAPRLAAMYAVNIMSLYGHYRWRFHMSQRSKNGAGHSWQGLETTDTWQNGYFSDKAKMRELAFWLK